MLRESGSKCRVVFTVIVGLNVNIYLLISIAQKQIQYSLKQIKIAKCNAINQYVKYINILYVFRPNPILLTSVFTADLR